MEIAFKIRQDLISYFNFVRLTSLLTPGHSGGIFNPKVKASLKATEEFINYADEESLIHQGPLILNALQPILDTAKRNFPPKRELIEISNAFSDLLKNEPELFSFGIPFCWVDNYIDTSGPIDPETPYQARIGTGFHAGKFSMEEMYLLDDGFFLLLLAENELELLHVQGQKLKLSNVGAYPDEDSYSSIRNINLNICSYARNSIINLYSFVECFVNSIGHNFYLRTKEKLTDQDKETLQGTKRGGYLSLETKMEKFHQIIRDDSKQVFCVTDKKQLKEPFLTFFEECKEIRDAAMHYSPSKEAIWRRPTDWTERAKKYSEIVIAVSQSFWEACYPQKDYPFYLRDLNYQDCYDGAKNRIEEANKAKNANTT